MLNKFEQRTKRRRKRKKNCRIKIQTISNKIFCLQRIPKLKFATHFSLFNWNGNWICNWMLTKCYIWKWQSSDIPIVHSAERAWDCESTWSSKTFLIETMENNMRFTWQSLDFVIISFALALISICLLVICWRTLNIVFKLRGKIEILQHYNNK